MKKTQEIIGLPVISISGGVEIGRVKGIIINADKGSADYIIVDSGMQSLNTMIIDAGDITGIGEYALTIEDEDDIKNINQVPEAVELLNKNVKIIGTKVITKKGRLIGRVSEFYVDEDNCCKITAVEYSSSKDSEKTLTVPRDSVITFGKDISIVEDTIEDELNEKESQPISENYIPETGEKEPAGSDEDDGISDHSEVEDADTNDVYEDASDLFDVTAATQEDNTAVLFEQRQRQYLTGRKATKAIFDDDGNVIINDGELITGEIIDEAKKTGKLIELVMNNRA